MHTDDALMERVRAGDEEAFAGIVDRYKDSLVNYLTHLVRSRERAEEVAQDAFVRLYRCASQYKEQERLGPYLFRIATNLVVTEARRQKRWTLLLPRLTASTRQSAPPADASVLADEVQRQVHTALGKLPVKYRAPLVLFELEEWSYDEIAKALELRSGTVKSRISRARDLMRKQLAPWWIGEKSHERHGNARLDASPAARESIARIHF